jgi:hypothetical protein
MEIKLGVKVRWKGKDESVLSYGKIYTVRSKDENKCRLIETGNDISYPVQLFEVVEVNKGTQVRWLGPTEFLMLTNQKVYTVLSVEKEWYRVVDDSGEDYLYPPELFEIVEE